MSKFERLLFKEGMKTSLSLYEFLALIPFALLIENIGKVDFMAIFVVVEVFSSHEHAFNVHFLSLKLPISKIN